MRPDGATFALSIGASPSLGVCGHWRNPEPPARSFIEDAPLVLKPTVPAAGEFVSPRSGECPAEDNLNLARL